MIAPHGGTLVQRMASGAFRDALREEARSLPAVSLAPRAAADTILIVTGAYSPLVGFMGSEAYHGVVDQMHLPGGLPWTLPITLPVDEETARRLGPGDRVTLRAPGLLAVLEVEDRFLRDLDTEAWHVFGTRDASHPGVARLREESPWAVGGPLWVVDRPHTPFPERTLDPTQTRQVFERAGWRTVTAFQTRNPIHRAHEYLQRCALEITDGLLLHPLVGETSGDDVPAAVRMRCYEVLLEVCYPRDRIVLAAFPATMRYAGPREAVFHAIVRKNYGCTHIVIGRDHAGVRNFYDPYDAHRIFARFDPRLLGITPLCFEDAFFCRGCQGMSTRKTCPHDESDRLNLSGTQIRSLLQAGQVLPEEIVRPEVATVLMQGLPASVERPPKGPLLQERGSG